MTRLAVISDVHADLRALKDALAQIERLGCDLTMCAGDLVDGGSHPEETIALLRDRQIPTIRGNHDRWATKSGHDMSGWDLTDRAISFLERLPVVWRQTLDGVRVLVTHARPGSDMNGIYPDTSDPDLLTLLDAAGVDVLLTGHTHVAMSVTLRGAELAANPGALLRDPVDQSEAALLFDPDLGKFVQGPSAGGGTFGVLDLRSLRFSVHRASDGQEVEITCRSS